MKKQFAIIVTIVFVLPLLAQTISWSDYRYNFRWINGSVPTFYSTPFPILIRPHASLGTYTPSPLPTNIGCFFEFGAIEMAMYNSVNTWNNVNAYPQFSVGGYTDIPVAFVADGVNIVAFSIGTDIFPIGSNLLAIARPHLLENSYNCSNNPLRPFLPSGNGFDIVFNDNQLFDVLDSSCETNFDYPYYDFETVLTHELGHALGLDHHPSVSSIDVMNGAIPNATKRRNLSAKDEAALKALYPNTSALPTV